MLLVKTVLILVAKVTRADVLGLELCPARPPFLCRIGIRISGDMAGPRSKAPTATSASTVKIIMSTNTARDDAAAATKPPSVGPT